MVTNAQFIPSNVLEKISQCFKNYDPPAIIKQVIITTSHTGEINIYYQTVDTK